MRELHTNGPHDEKEMETGSLFTASKAQADHKDKATNNKHVSNRYRTALADCKLLNGANGNGKVFCRDSDCIGQSKRRQSKHNGPNPKTLQKSSSLRITSRVRSSHLVNALSCLGIEVANRNTKRELRAKSKDLGHKVNDNNETYNKFSGKVRRKQRKEDQRTRTKEKDKPCLSNDGGSPKHSSQMMAKSKTYLYYNDNAVSKVSHSLSDFKVSEKDETDCILQNSETDNATEAYRNIITVPLNKSFRNKSMKDSDTHNETSKLSNDVALKENNQKITEDQDKLCVTKYLDSTDTHREFHPSLTESSIAFLKVTKIRNSIETIPDTKMEVTKAIGTENNCTLSENNDSRIIGNLVGNMTKYDEARGGERLKRSSSAPPCFVSSDTHKTICAHLDLPIKTETNTSLNKSNETSKIENTSLIEDFKVQRKRKRVKIRKANSRRKCASVRTSSKNISNTLTVPSVVFIQNQDSWNLQKRKHPDNRNYVKENHNPNCSFLMSEMPLIDMSQKDALGQQNNTKMSQKALVNAMCVTRDHVPKETNRQIIEIQNEDSLTLDIGVVGNASTYMNACTENTGQISKTKTFATCDTDASSKLVAVSSQIKRNQGAGENEEMLVPSDVQNSNYQMEINSLLSKELLDKTLPATEWQIPLYVEDLNEQDKNKIVDRQNGTLNAYLSRQENQTGSGHDQYKMPNSDKISKAKTAQAAPVRPTVQAKETRYPTGTCRSQSFSSSDNKSHIFLNRQKTFVFPCNLKSSRTTDSTRKHVTFDKIVSKQQKSHTSCSGSLPTKLSNSSLGVPLKHSYSIAHREVSQRSQTPTMNYAKPDAMTVTYDTDADSLGRDTPVKSITRVFSGIQSKCKYTDVFDDSEIRGDYNTKVLSFSREMNKENSGNKIQSIANYFDRQKDEENNENNCTLQVLSEKNTSVHNICLGRRTSFLIQTTLNKNK